MRTRCRSASRRPIGMNGWTSPREPDDHDDDGQRRHAWRLGRRAGAAASPLVCAASHGGTCAKQARGVIEVHLQAVAGPGRDDLEPAHGGDAQTAAMQPSPQEGGWRPRPGSLVSAVTHRVPSHHPYARLRGITAPDSTALGR